MPALDRHYDQLRIKLVGDCDDRVCNNASARVSAQSAYVHKPTFRQGHRAVLSRAMGGTANRINLAGSPAATRFRRLWLCSSPSFTM